MEPASAPTADPGLVILGGTLAAHGRPGRTMNISLARTDSEWVIDSVSPEAVPPKTDTIDASGLYIHNAGLMGMRPAARAGHRPVLYTLRAGPSPGAPAVWRVGPGLGRDYWRRIAPGENHPPGGPDHRVGCYRVEHGEWPDPQRAEELLRRTPVLPDLRLHWQHLWQFGREFLLVATDAAGAVPEPYDYLHIWRPLPGDSLRIDFGRGHGHEALLYRVARRGEDYVGTLTLVRLGDSPDAEVRMRRMPCPPDPQFQPRQSRAAYPEAVP